MRTVPEETLQNIIQRPNFLDSVTGKGKGSNRLKYAKIAETLKMIAADKCLSYAWPEFQREFGKCGLLSMRFALKKCGIVHPRVFKDKDVVYVWHNHI